MVERDPFIEYPQNQQNFVGFKGLFVASVHDRLLSFILDLLIFTPFLGLLHAVVIKKITLFFYTGSFSAELFLFLLFLLGSNFFVIGVLQAFWIHFFGATPGQMFLKLKVVTKDNKLTWSQAFQRSFGFCLSLVTLGIPFIGILSHPKRQAWYERMSDSLVMTTKSEPYNQPHWLEIKFFEQIRFIGFSIFVILFSVLLSKVYQTADEGSYKQAELLKSNYLCDSVGDETVQGVFRLDKALALFKMGLITERCALSEADFALWNRSSELNSWGYLIKSQIYEYDKEKSRKYQDLACESRDSSACAVIRDAGALSEEYYSARFLNYQSQLADANYSEALSVLEGFRQEPEFQDFLLSENMKNLWRQKKSEQAYGAWSQVKAVGSDENVIESSAWYCEQSLKANRCQSSSAACEHLKNIYSAERPIDRLDVALSLGFEKSCRKTSALSWQQFEQIISSNPGFQGWLQITQDWAEIKPGFDIESKVISQIQKLLVDNKVTSEIKDRLIYIYSESLFSRSEESSKDLKFLEAYMQNRGNDFKNELGPKQYDFMKQSFQMQASRQNFDRNSRAPASIKSAPKKEK